MKSLPRNDPFKAHGFSLVHALVAVGVVAVLTAVLIPVFLNLRENSRRAACVGNLRALGQGLELYAAEHRGRLPVVEPVGLSPWDVSVNVIDALTSRGVRKEHFYCPSGPVEATDHYWNFHVQDEDGRWRNLFRIITYVPLLEGVPRVLPEFTNAAALPLVRDNEVPSDRELVIDVVMSATGGRHGSFAARTIGGHEVPDRTSHLKGDRPAGGNILFLDGHIAWRDFEEMDDTKIHGVPVFWW